MNRKDYNTIKDLMLTFLANVDHISRRRRTEDTLKKIYELLKNHYESKKETEKNG